MVNKIKRVIPLFLFAAFIAFIVFAPTGREGRLIEGGPAPDFELADLGGATWSLSGLRGSAVLINFWATWCPPCREEMSSLERLYESASGMPDFNVITILYEDDPLDAAAFLERNGYGLPSLVDPDGAVAASYGLTGVPESFLIDRNGVLRKKIIGPFSFDSPDAIRLYQKVLSR